eukprot:6375765-Alexandrium_andersonii.AAC.1
MIGLGAPCNSSKRGFASPSGPSCLAYNPFCSAFWSSSPSCVCSAPLPFQARRHRPRQPGRLSA